MILGVSRRFAPGDPWPIALLFLGVVVLVAVAALSHEHERAWSATIIYLGCGLLAAVGLKLLGVDALDPLRDARYIQRLTELALIVAVFAAGLTIERRVERRQWRSVAVLLVVAMPVTIAAIAAFGMAAMGLSFAGALLLGAVLAPTDPVLAGDVGLGAPGESDTSPEPRFSLHTEAAINDGLASPFVLLGLFVAGEGGTGWLGSWVLSDVLYGIGVSAVLGAAAGTGIARLVVTLRGRGLLDPQLDTFVALGAVLVVYGAAEALDTYGLLAVFAAGFFFRRYEFGHEVNRRLHDGAGGVGKVLELAVILMLGSLVTVDGLGVPGIAGWLLAPLLVFVIRPAVVLPIADRRLMSGRERLFLAWFGVRGVAALFYAAVVVRARVLPLEETRIIFWTVAVCVMVSIVVHGVTATPLTRRWLVAER